MMLVLYKYCIHVDTVDTHRYCVNDGHARALTCGEPRAVFVGLVETRHDTHAQTRKRAHTHTHVLSLTHTRARTTLCRRRSQVREQGTHEELMARPGGLYRSFVTAQGNNNSNNGNNGDPDPHGCEAGKRHTSRNGIEGKSKGNGKGNGKGKSKGNSTGKHSSMPAEKTNCSPGSQHNPSSDGTPCNEAPNITTGGSNAGSHLAEVAAELQLVQVTDCTGRDSCSGGCSGGGSCSSCGGLIVTAMAVVLLVVTAVVLLTAVEVVAAAVVCHVLTSCTHCSTPDSTH